MQATGSPSAYQKPHRALSLFFYFFLSVEKSYSILNDSPGLTHYLAKRDMHRVTITLAFIKERKNRSIGYDLVKLYPKIGTAQMLRYKSLSINGPYL
jgi:hypothetical protein